MGLRDCRDGGLDRRRDTDCWLQLSHKAATEITTAGKSSVSRAWRKEKGKERKNQEENENKVTHDEDMAVYSSNNKEAWSLDKGLKKLKWNCKVKQWGGNDR